MSTKSHYLAALLVFSTVLSGCVPNGLDTAQGVDEDRRCIYNGFNYIPPDGQIAEYHHCYTTPDNSTIAPLAKVDDTKTMADLRETQNWDALHPDHYLARGTMATRGIPDDAPMASNSADVALFVSDELPRKYLSPRWKNVLRLGASVGMGTDAYDNIPIYTVDSSNPYQEFQTFSATDKRASSFAKIMEMNSGKIPFPKWGEPTIGGDHALAIYDMGTGIWRSYYGVTPTADGGWKFASAGYWYGDKERHVAGGWNYWLGLIQGTSSVVGLSNELTQIGPEEVRRDEINHMISLSFPDYKAGKASFPAKLTDGGLDPKEFPNAPEAGQVFTFPKDFDVRAYAEEHNIDPTMTAIMLAIQNYGGIITDKNHWVMSLNFANPRGFGVRAEDQDNNLWASDPVLQRKMTEMNRDLNKFPWNETAWLAPDYAGH